MGGRVSACESTTSAAALNPTGQHRNKLPITSPIRSLSSKGSVKQGMRLKCAVFIFFVNLSMVPAESHAERDRLLLMARKLYRFSTLLMWPALILGIWIWMAVGIGRGPGNIWMHIKLLLVILAIGYHHGCGRILR
jgi:hypothetical protein